MTARLLAAVTTAIPCPFSRIAVDQNDPPSPASSAGSASNSRRAAGLRQGRLRRCRPVRPAPDERALARQLFGSVDRVPDLARRVVAAVCGARSGKTRLGALLLLYLALTVNVSALAPGESAFGVIVAPDLRLASQAMSYVRSAVASRKGARGGGRLRERTAHRAASRRQAHRDHRGAAREQRRRGDARRNFVGALLDEACFFRDKSYAVNDEGYLPLDSGSRADGRAGRHPVDAVGQERAALAHASEQLRRSEERARGPRGDVADAQRPEPARARGNRERDPRTRGASSTQSSSTPTRSFSRAPTSTPARETTPICLRFSEQSTSRASTQPRAPTRSRWWLAVSTLTAAWSSRSQGVAAWRWLAARPARRRARGGGRGQALRLRLGRQRPVVRRCAGRAVRRLRRRAAAADARRCRRRRGVAAPAHAVLDPCAVVCLCNAQLRADLCGVRRRVSSGGGVSFALPRRLTGATRTTPRRCCGCRWWRGALLVRSTRTPRAEREKRRRARDEEDQYEAKLLERQGADWRRPKGSNAWLRASNS